ncbi:MAG: hypothetical protein AAF602_15500 [Myxococcota bacterium]
MFRVVYETCLAMGVVRGRSPRPHGETFAALESAGFVPVQTGDHGYWVIDHYRTFEHRDGIAVCTTMGNANPEVGLSPVRDDARDALPDWLRRVMADH